MSMYRFYLFQSFALWWVRIYIESQWLVWSHFRNNSTTTPYNSTTRLSENVKEQHEFKHLKEAMVIDYRIWCFKLVFWPPRRSSSAKMIVLSELKSTLRNSFHLSASSCRSEEVKMLRVMLFTERGQCSEYPLGLQNIHSSCFAQRIILFWRPRRRACWVVDLKVSIIYEERSEKRFCTFTFLLIGKS